MHKNDPAAQGMLTTRREAQLTKGRRSTDCVADCNRIPVHAAACITVDLMGGLTVRTGRTTLGPRDLGGTKLRRVLIALLLHRGAPVSKSRLVALVWDGSAPSGAQATLESYVCLLRKKLQPCKQTSSSLIKTQSGCYSIDMSRVDLDLVRYERLLSRGLQPDTPDTEALTILQQAMMMAERPLLPEEIDCEWLDEMRKIHNQQVRNGLTAAANKVAALPTDTAQRWARLALDGDSLDESAWHALLRSMEARGQHAEGLRAYDQCRRLLATELGCSPGPGLREVYLRLLRGGHAEDGELSLLFDAVVRLHAASQLSALPTTAPPQNAPHQVTSGEDSSSVEQARSALHLLLRTVTSDRQPPGLALGV